MEKDKLIKFGILAGAGILVWSALTPSTQEDSGFLGSGSFGGLGGGEEVTSPGSGETEPLVINFPEIPSFTPEESSPFIMPASASSNLTEGGSDRSVSGLTASPETLTKKGYVTQEFNAQGDAVSYGGGGAGAIKGESIGSKILSYLTVEPEAPSYPSSGTAVNDEYDLTGVNPAAVMGLSSGGSGTGKATVVKKDLGIGDLANSPAFDTKAAAVDPVEAIASRSLSSTSTKKSVTASSSSVKASSSGLASYASRTGKKIVSVKR